MFVTVTSFVDIFRKLATGEFSVKADLDLVELYESKGTVGIIEIYGECRLAPQFAYLRASLTGFADHNFQSVLGVWQDGGK